MKKIVKLTESQLETIISDQIMKTTRSQTASMKKNKIKEIEMEKLAVEMKKDWLYFKKKFENKYKNIKIEASAGAHAESGGGLYVIVKNYHPFYVESKDPERNIYYIDTEE